MISTKALSEALNPDKSNSNFSNLFLENMAMVVEIEKALFVQYKESISELQQVTAEQ